MRLSKHSTTTARGKAPRARRCVPSPPATRPRPAAIDEEHARRIVKLRAQKRQLVQRLDRVSKLLDVELIAARRDKTLYSIVGQAVQAAEGRPQTAEDLARVERELRKLTHHARRRRDPGGNQAGVAGSRARTQTARMTTPIRRRIEVTEEWYAPPPEDSPPPGSLAEADLDEAESDDEDENHDELDGEDDDADDADDEEE